MTCQAAQGWFEVQHTGSINATVLSRRPVGESISPKSPPGCQISVVSRSDSTCHNTIVNQMMNQTAYEPGLGVEQVLSLPRHAQVDIQMTVSRI